MLSMIFLINTNAIDFPFLCFLIESKSTATMTFNFAAHFTHNLLLALLILASIECQSLAQFFISSICHNVYCFWQISVLLYAPRISSKFVLTFIFHFHFSGKKIIQYSLLTWFRASGFFFVNGCFFLNSRELEFGTLKIRSKELSLSQKLACFFLFWLQE